MFTVCTENTYFTYVQRVQFKNKLRMFISSYVHIFVDMTRWLIYFFKRKKNHFVVIDNGSGSY